MVNSDPYVPTATFISILQNVLYGGVVFMTQRSGVRFPLVSLEFFSDIILPEATMALRSTQPPTEMITRFIAWWQRLPLRKPDNLTTILCHCHEIWEP